MRNLKAREENKDYIVTVEWQAAESRHPLLDRLWDRVFGQKVAGLPDPGEVKCEQAKTGERG